jgi:DNA-binding LacI/PurR family transcriptional regulator
LNDVAREVGVSSATVSLVLNGGSSTSRVSEATRRRIEAAASKLDYRPNAVARSLARRRTDIIGFYCGYGPFHSESPFEGAIMRGMLSVCDAHGKDLLLHNERHMHSARSTYDQLANGKLDALVLFSPPSDELVKLLADSALPAIVIADSVPDLPSVVVDDAGGAHLLARHLVSRGHRRIMYRLPASYATPSTSVRRRLAAFREFADGNGISVVETHEGSRVDHWDGALSSDESALLAGPRGERPTAVVCWNDMSAYGFIPRIRAAGMRVPEDVAVVGFNGIWSEASQFCNLTTIRGNWPNVGSAAMALLLGMLDGKDAPPETVLPVDLIVGETT